MTTEPITIPDARAQLSRWALEWDRPELLDLVARMVRHKPKYPKARARRGSLTKELAIKIRKYKDEYPDLSNRDIGEFFGVDGGRVSEAIHNTHGFFKEGDQ